MTDRSTHLPRPTRAAADVGRSRLGDSTRPVVRERRILTDWRGTTLLAVVAVAIAGALAAALFLIPIRTLFDQEARIAQRSEQVVELETVVADLQREVDRLATPDGVREAAREELGYIQAGEIRETVLELPDLPLDLPDGWPYSLVNDITYLRRGGPPPVAVGRSRRASERLPLPPMRSTIGRLRLAIAMVISVFVVGTVGYLAFGLSVIDAMYMTLTTITTVGFREITEPEVTTGEKLFTMSIIVVGVGTVLYTLTLVVQMVVEGQISEAVGRKRMDKKIADMRGHVVVCGWGRVGRAVAGDLRNAGQAVVVVDIDPERLADVEHPTVAGDATLDSTLRAAGIEHAVALVAALEGDAENLFVTLSSKEINPSLFIVARAREDESVAKLSRAGADRVVNPQELGAARMASFVVQPNVAEFVDVIMHERSMDFRMQEVEIPAGSPLAGQTLREANLRQQAGVLVLALRGDDGTFQTNPDPDVVLHAQNVVIAVGTDDALQQLVKVCG